MSIKAEDVKGRHYEGCDEDRVKRMSDWETSLVELIVAGQHAGIGVPRRHLSRLLVVAATMPGWVVPRLACLDGIAALEDTHGEDAGGRHCWLLLASGGRPTEGPTRSDCCYGPSGSGRQSLISVRGR
ncbi:hypothetical protein DM860_017411 [Cuscuta australis]|uniref:Uncharacterized protein n=1 Tax=Cuscuta australis TaxID=267555 RepID=A0A328CYD0_9ASTE|nr:hypothetical protein DM860_017411 [Cuscuta australis]